MPKNKNALKRYIVIHNALNRGVKQKTKYLADLCRNKFGINVSTRTIQGDLRDLAEDSELGFYLPIKKDTQTKTYYYTEHPVPFLPAIELEQAEINALLFYIKTVNQYRDYLLFDDISTAIKKVIDSSNIPSHLSEIFSSNSMLETEKHPLVDGTEYIPEILRALLEHRTLKITYLKHKGAKKKAYELQPVMLKEDKQLWYALVIDLGVDKLKTFALDRIQSLSVSDNPYDPIAFDPDVHFKYSFGVTVTQDDPIDVVISFAPETGDYLRTLPIHPTQRNLVDNKKEFKIQVTVNPTYEFYSKLRSYGENATVVSPLSVRQVMKDGLKASLLNYGIE